MRGKVISQHSGGRPEGSSSTKYAFPGGVGILVLSLSSCAQAIETAIANKNLELKAGDWHSYSNQSKDITPKEKVILDNYAVSASLVLNPLKEVSQTPLTIGSTSVLQNNATNSDGAVNKVEFAVTDINSIDPSGKPVSTNTTIISFRDDNVEPTEGELDITTRSFIFDSNLPTSTTRSETEEHTLVTLRGADLNKNMTPFMIIVMDKLPSNANIHEAIKDPKKIEEVSIFNPVTGEELVVPQGEQVSPPTSTPSTPKELPLDIIELIGNLIEPSQGVSAQEPTSTPPDTEQTPPDTEQTPSAPTIKLTGTNVDGKKITVSVPDILKIASDPVESKKPENEAMAKAFNSSVEKFVNKFIEKQDGETDDAFKVRKQAFLEETKTNLKPELINVDGKQFVVLLNLDGYPLLITDNESNWVNNFNEFTNAVNISTGIYLEPNKSGNLENGIAKNNFDDIVLPIFWHTIFAQKDFNNFGLPDSALDVAGSEMGQFGGALLWQNTNFLPEWFKNEDVNEDQIRSMITIIMQKYPDTKVWIPVNEPYSTDFFANKLGYPDYVVMAFDEARKHTDAPLILNDFDIEKTGSTKYNQTKKLVESLKEQNLIDGIGIQMHIDPNNPPTKEKLIENFQSWGIDVYLTELDVPTENEELKAKIFSDIFSAAIESGVVKQVNFWGLGKAAWRQNGNLFDQNGQPNQAFFEIEKAIVEHLMLPPQ